LFKTCISVMVGTLYKKGDARRDGGFSLVAQPCRQGDRQVPEGDKNRAVPDGALLA
jgi:POT family proton-dependent oligopeptide transporter